MKTLRKLPRYKRTHVLRDAGFWQDRRIADGAAVPIPGGVKKPTYRDGGIDWEASGLGNS
ncbi:MAG: hypothetical protein V4467_04090 [Patescibacteria group bacterium]